MCYVNVLEVYPDYREAFNTACYLYHEKIFRFSEAFELSRKWLEKHPDDVDALADFTEQHLTSGRFAELEILVKPLLSNPDLESSSRVALRAIEISALLALNNTDQVRRKMEEIVADIAGQPADFKINWGSEGVKYGSLVFPGVDFH